MLQELHRFAAVDQAVVVRDGDVHHRSNNNGAVANHRPVLNRVQSENATLRRIDNRRLQQRSVDAAVANRKRAPLQLRGKNFALFGAAREIGDGAFDFGECEPLGIAQHGNH